MSLPRVDLGPVQVASATWAEALAHTEAQVREGGRHYFCFCEASLLSNVGGNADLARALHRADAVFPDGVALMLLARLRGKTLPERIPGPSFLLAACRHGVAHGWRHFFYGGAPGVAEALAARLREDFPGIAIAGTYSPPFRPLTEPEEKDIKHRIESSGAHLLWVCLGSPKQELWVAAQLGKIQVPLMLAVGAAFDFHSGHRPWAPAWVRSIGMEWAFRTLTGGRRTFLRNLRCVSVVAWILFKAALARAGTRRPSSA
jgi:N-acetylglucosaminyldiphosphoundecaprenol N-acetyl-beta-D-mannosaminyltransferase